MWEEKLYKLYRLREINPPLPSRTNTSNLLITIYGVFKIK